MIRKIFLHQEYAKILSVRIIKIAIKNNKSVAVDVQLEMDLFRMNFINLVDETKLKDENLKELINSIGKPTKIFSNGNWYKKLCLDKPDFAN